MIKRVLCCGLAISLAAPAAAETLREAVLAAVQTSPTLAAARARQDALSETVSQARSAGRLTTSADVAVGYDRFNYGKGGSASLGAALPLWTGGRVASAVRAARADVAAGDETVRDSQAALLTDVVGAYAALLFDQQSVAIARSDIELLNRQVGEAQARFALGTSTRTDVAQLEAQRASATASLAAADATLDTTTAQYVATVGHDPGNLALPEAPLASLPGTLDQARARAMSNNPLVLASRHAVEAAFARVEGARSNGRPTVALGAAYGYQAGFSNGGGQTAPYDASAAIGIHVPILTGGLVSSQIRQARSTYRAYEYDRDAQARDITRSVDAAWASLSGAHRQIEADTGRVAAADLALKGVRAEYAFGLRTTLDILVADESLRSAQLSLASDRSNALVAEAALLRATGTLTVLAFDSP